MAAPVNVSPLIRTARWSLLGLGFFYGYKHKDTVAKWRAEERPAEIAAKEKYFADIEAAKAAANIEFQRTSILYGNSDENPGEVEGGTTNIMPACEAGSCTLKKPEDCDEFDESEIPADILALFDDVKFDWHEITSNNAQLLVVEDDEGDVASDEEDK